MSKKQLTKKRIRKEQRRRKKKQMKKNKNEGTEENKDEYKELATTTNEGLSEFLNEPIEQSNQTKQQTLPSNPRKEDHNNQSANVNDNIGIKHGLKEEQLKLVPIKNGKQLIQIKLDKNDKSDSLVPISEEGIPKEADNNCEHLNEEISKRDIEGDINQASTSACGKKNSDQTKKSKACLGKKKHPQKKSNKNSFEFYRDKKTFRKIMPMSSSNHKIEPSDKKYFNMASMKDEKNAYIVNNINPNKSNKFSHDNSLLDPCKYSNHDEQGNTPCSRKILDMKIPCENFSSEEMEKLRKAGIVFNEIPNLIQN